MSTLRFTIAWLLGAVTSYGLAYLLVIATATRYPAFSGSLLDVLNAIGEMFAA